MEHKPVITADALSPDWMGAAARPLPDRVHQSSSGVRSNEDNDRTSTAAKSGAWTSALRWMRDAAIGLAIITSIPLVAIATRADVMSFNHTETNARIAQIDKLRVLRLPATSELSPLAAGQLWHATDVMPRNGMFPTHPAAPPAERGWEKLSLTEDMFTGVRRQDRHLVQSADILRAAQKELSPAELEYLRTVAEAPIWSNVDRIASARAIDVIGARYVLPFRDDASPVLMHIPRFAATKEIAYAGLSRAAYHVAQGEPERAEHALRSVLSYGFVILDNGSTAIEALIGRVVAGIAMEGLHTLYTMTGNEAGAALTAPMETASAATRNVDGRMTEENLAAISRDPSLSRTIRLEGLRALAFSSCTSVRGAIFGPSAESQAAFVDARKSLARYPSELAFIDLLQDAPNRPLGNSEIESKAEWLLLGAASVASTVLNNPRIQTCTRVLNAYH